MATTRSPVRLQIQGVALAAGTLPSLLQAGSRSVSDADNRFLPPGFVQSTQAYDLSRSARATVVQAAHPDVEPDAVLSLELEEGVTVFVRADQFREDLERSDPDAIRDGEVILDEAVRDRGVSQRGLFGDVVRHVFVLKLGTDEIIADAKAQLLEWLGEQAGAELGRLGVSWWGTKALMWAIERQLGHEPGLYRWGDDGALRERLTEGDARLAQAAQQGPLLVFIHGTGSSAAGSFGDLRSADAAADWRALEARYGDRIYAFEHRTLSESPVENALALARVLPAGARLHLVTHSRGGLVGDLLGLDGLDAEALQGFKRRKLGDPELDAELERADAADRERLRELAAVLALRRFHIERYVRVACPARGTRLASANFDVFMSGLLSLIGLVPTLAGSPFYAAFKRVVLEVARNRTRPECVPGIEAMLPDAPLGRLLLAARPVKDLRLAVIAGDIEGGGLLKRLGVLFTDYVFFDAVNNDLVVDTDSMYAGLARPGAARQRFEQGADVSHFRYFANRGSRAALRQWLTAPEPDALAEFEPLAPGFDEPKVGAEPVAGAPARGGAADRPIVVLLPGIMGSHLTADGGRDRIWFDPLDIAAGKIERLRWGSGGIAAERPFDLFYGDLMRYLARSQRVEPFAYDWRQPLEVLGEALAARVRDWLAQTAQPIRFLAHNMGGLVVRAMIARHPDLWDEVMARDGARFVMLGTPNRGSHRMVETLLGKSELIRRLARIDLGHSLHLQELLDLVAAFPGALQLLPQPGFVDESGEAGADYYAEPVWHELKAACRDLWFGDRVAATPAQAALDAVHAQWDEPNFKAARLPERHRQRTIYVYGMADNTPCGLSRRGGVVKMLGTPRGDGAVTWKSGALEGVGAYYYMPVPHGELPDTPAYFPALEALLERGATDALPTAAPTLRGVAPVRSYDAGPTPYPTAEEVARGLLDARPRTRARRRAVPTLAVQCTAMDLRCVTQPIMVGHYEQDTIAGAEALIDRELVNHELTLRKHLGLYPEAIGTATVVLQARNEQEQRRGSYRGAVVIGLGKLGELTGAGLTEAVRTGTLRYLLQLTDIRAGRGEAHDADICLASLLVGSNSTTNLTIEDSVSAIVRGVLEANRQFVETMTPASPTPPRVTRLQFVEIFLENAIAAAKAIRTLAAQINERDSARYGMRVEAASELCQGDGMRQRLDVGGVQSFWPRLIIADADREPDDETPRDAQQPATRLRFVFLGQRARAEMVVHQRQPGLVEKLVDKSVNQPRFRKELSRSLFQLMVPNDFKDAARQVERMMLVVDGYTANLPWELMLADDQPLAVQTALVRQLRSTRFRQRVRTTLDALAYVVGNPSTQGFAASFPRASRDPEPLAGAEEEACAVRSLLAQQGFQVTEAIGRDQEALDVINKLYLQPYRIIHIAAHGVYAEPDGHGLARSGVVLSDGLLLGAAEIGQMEVVPDLVFLNCCHLGKTDTLPVAFNRLAYSVARELIEIGVRAVVVAGWAVDDQAARLFAETFYGALIGGDRPFGEAVFTARKKVYERYPESNTWGAYQAYGDPGFLIRPGVVRANGGASAAWQPVTIEELIERLTAARNDIRRMAKALDTREARRRAAECGRLLKACPARWLSAPSVNAELGRYFAELGPAYFGKARRHLEQAVQAEDRLARVPITALELLANLEARQGEIDADLPLVDRAIQRLLALVEGTGAGTVNPERCALLGSAYKRRAVVLARGEAGANGSRKLRGQVSEALSASITWYQRAEGAPGEGNFRPYHALNRLALQAVVDFERPEVDGDRVALARFCAEAATERFRREPNFWDAIGVADAQLTQSLLDRTLEDPGAPGDLALETVRRAYREGLVGTLVQPKHLDSVVAQIRQIAELYRALVKFAQRDRREAAQRTALRLDTLAGDLAPRVAQPPLLAESQDAER